MSVDTDDDACREVVDRHAPLAIVNNAGYNSTGAIEDLDETEARRCFEIIGQALDDAGASFADVVRSRVYLVDAADFASISRVHGEVVADVRPANTTVVVAALLDPAWKVEIEVEAVVSTDPAVR